MGMGQALSWEIHRQCYPCGIGRGLSDDSLFLCGAYCHTDAVGRAGFFQLYGSLYHCIVRLFGKGYFRQSFNSHFSHSNLLHAVRSAGEHYRKAGPRANGDDSGYALWTV